MAYLLVDKIADKTLVEIIAADSILVKKLQITYNVLSEIIADNILVEIIAISIFHSVMSILYF